MARMDSLDELLRDWNRDHKKILEGLDQLSKADKQQKLPRTEVVTEPLTSKPSAMILAPPTPPNRESYRDEGEIPHIGSPLSAEGVRWLKQHDPSIISACNSAKDGEVLSVRTAIDAVCARHSLQRSDIQAHSDVLGFDIGMNDADAAHVQQMMQDMADDEGWAVSYNNELRVLYKHARNSKLHSVKLQAEFEAPLWHVMALMVEFDLTKTWNAFMQDTTILFANLPLLTCIYGALWTPFFLFDAAVKAEAFDIGLEDKSVLVRLSNIPEDELAGYDLPPAHKKRRRASVGWGSCFRLEALPPTPEGKHRVRASAVAHLNPHLPFVPGFLVNFVLKVASPFGFKMMKKVLNELFKEPDSVFNKRIEMRPEVYQMCKKKTKVLMKHFYGIDIDVDA